MRILIVTMISVFAVGITAATLAAQSVDRFVVPVTVEGQTFTLTVSFEGETLVVVPSDSDVEIGNITRELAPVPPTSPVATMANRNANLRNGPGILYAVVGSARLGQPLQVTGKNVDGTWYQLADGKWIAAFLVNNAPVDLPTVNVAPPVGPLPVAPPAPAPTAAP